MTREGHTEFNEIMGDWLVFFRRTGYCLISQTGGTPGLRS